LERSAALASIDPKKPASKYSWASVEEIVAVLEGLGGETSDSILELEIASAHGIDKALVHKQLSNDALTWLRPSKGKWAIPSREFDL
jgi:hypothetical protein